MKKIVSAVALMLAMSCGAHAGGPSYAGKTFSSPAGMPFCTNEQSLAMYMAFGLKGDAEAMKAISDCGSFKGGLKVTVLEDFASESDIGHVVKVRVFSPLYAGKSSDGYTLSLAFDPQ